MRNHRTFFVSAQSVDFSFSWHIFCLGRARTYTQLKGKKKSHGTAITKGYCYQSETVDFDKDKTEAILVLKLGAGKETRRKKAA